MCTGVGQRAAAVILVLWLSTAGATLGGLFGGQDSVLRQGNRAWEPDPSWPSPEGPQFRAPEPFDNPWTSSQSSPAEDRDKTLDVQTLTNIINVARYILSFPQKCFYRGNAYSCGLGVSCWIQGKRPVDLCNGGVIWSCCVPRNAEPSKAGMVKDARKSSSNLF